MHKYARGRIRVSTLLVGSCMDTGSLDRKRSTRDKWWVATAVLPGQLTVAFGMFGVVVVLPNLITAFGTDVQPVQWVMTGYLVARVVPMPAMGWLVHQLAQRNVYVLGVLGTTVSTVLCGLAWSMESLIAFRVVQGVLGASVMSIGMVLLYEAFPAEQRGLAMGLCIMVASLGPTLGQSVGGYLVQQAQLACHFFSGAPHLYHDDLSRSAPAGAVAGPATRVGVRVYSGTPGHQWHLSWAVAGDGITRRTPGGAPAAVP